MPISTKVCWVELDLQGAANRRHSARLLGFRSFRSSNASQKARSARKEENGGAPALRILVSLPRMSVQSAYRPRDPEANAQQKCQTPARPSKQEVLLLRIVAMLTVLAGRNEDSSQAASFRAHDALRKQKSRAAGNV